MDLSMPPHVEAFRSEVRAFLTDVLPDDWAGYAALPEQERATFAEEWRETLLERGFLAVAWPEEYGGLGLGLLEQSVLAEEFVRAGVPYQPLPSDGQGLVLIGPTLREWGSEEQKAHFIPRIFTGEHRWAQGFSEPEAGSDLASLRTTARRDGDAWVINGQKVWQTAGDAANWIYILARTHPDKPRHRGISMLLVPIDQAGVEVRPIRSMTGDEEFCEVFFTDARTSLENVVGGVDNGWRVAMTLLGFERGATAAATAVASRIELDRLAELARTHGRLQDPLFRQRFAWCHSKVEIMRLLALRNLSSAQAGGTPGPESSISKIYGSEYRKKVTELAMSVLGIHGGLATGRSAVATLGADPLGGANSAAAWETVFLTARAGTIYGGSSQIQRNLLGERLLGLPREPSATSG